MQYEKNDWRLTNLNLNSQTEIWPNWISICSDKLKSKLFLFQFVLTNWNPNCSYFNLFWQIEIQIVYISIIGYQWKFKLWKIKTNSFVDNSIIVFFLFPVFCFWCLAHRCFLFELLFSWCLAHRCFLFTLCCFWWFAHRWCFFTCWASNELNIFCLCNLFSKGSRWHPNRLNQLFSENCDHGLIPMEIEAYGMWRFFTVAGKDGYLGLVLS